jgi:small subunit ribosomal protein S9
MADARYIYALGKRKTATAQVRLYSGSGDSTINGRPFNEYIGRADLFEVIHAPFKAVGAMGKYHFSITVSGSGESAQAQAISLGIARALTAEAPEARKLLKPQGLLKRDARKVERKKPGLHKARKAIQWSKR